MVVVATTKRKRQKDIVMNCIGQCDIEVGGKVHLFEGIK